MPFEVIKKEYPIWNTYEEKTFRNSEFITR